MSKTDDLIKSYEDKCAGIGSSADPETLKRLAVDGQDPALALSPKSHAEVSAVLAWASEQGVSLVPRGAGTKLALGSPMDEGAEFVVLSLGGLDQICEHDADNLTVTVECGVTVAGLQKRVAEKRQLLPLDPPRLEQATIGGVLAANSSGPRRLLYGSARDLVLGMKVVTPDGTLIKCGGKTVKNVAGYDMSKLFIGSMGTLGVLVEATLRLVPLPTTAQTVVLTFDGLDAAADAVAAVLSSFLLPSAVELINPAAAGRLFDRVSVPMAGRHAVVVLFEGFQDAVDRQVREIRKGPCTQSLEIPKDKEESLWGQIRDLVPAETDTVRCKVSVPISNVRDIAASCERHAAAVLSHAGSGIVHAVLSGDCERPAEAVAELRRQAAELGGSLVVEMAPPELKAEVGVWGDVGSPRGLMQSIRQAFDPKGILNPGRFAV